MTAYHLRGQSQQEEAEPDLSGLEPFSAQEALVLSTQAGLWEEERRAPGPALAFVGADKEIRFSLRSLPALQVLAEAPKQLY